MLPQEVKATLWSYDVSKIDIEKSKEIIITQVLNFGTKDAITWLFNTYTKSDIKHITENPRPGMWNKKSLNFWALLFNISPSIKNRF